MTSRRTPDAPTRRLTDRELADALVRAAIRPRPRRRTPDFWLDVLAALSVAILSGFAIWIVLTWGSF